MPTVPEATFFDMQGAVGVTKHMGGYTATDELLDLCRIRDAHDVLDVGCGIGVGPVHIARTYGCHVTGVDLSDRMVEWARRRVRNARVESLVELRSADVLSLPFPDDSFDVVMCESVLDFVEDKQAAVRELVRVAKPGGRVGLNEGVWIDQPPADLVERVKDALGPAIPTEQAWRGIWSGSGLDQQDVRVHRVDARTEMRDRLRWIGWRWLPGAWLRALRLAVTTPSVRGAMRRQLDVPADVFRYVGYGLFVGTKPGNDR